ncbi:MAG TPA: DNA mismatch repair endonuclease MutH [Polyangiaceae bacterium]|nr:DNA mismatch repair endonuclease MutH [Polyangiaceae bacterium]
MLPVPEPRSEAELMARAQRLAGMTLGQLAGAMQVEVPAELLRAKGFVGQLLERALGASARSKAVPDFTTLGIELKSLPVSDKGVPLETTFVCTIRLLDAELAEWDNSRLRQKLSRVLWVPVMGLRQVPVAERLIGTPLLWSPSAEDERDLRWDWDELMGMIGRGQVERITGHLGKVLQIRPKARNAKARRRAWDDEGNRMLALPRGFYLRTAFTHRILQRHFTLPG